MIDSRFSERSGESVQTLPRKQEWAIIADQRAKEFERARSMQKMMSQEKRDKFKNQLDMQLMQKNSMKRDQKEEDRKYYQYIIQKSQEMKEREEKEKFKRFLKSKELEEQNKMIMDNPNSPKKDQFGKIYNIPIGLKSEMEKKERAEEIRKSVIATLDRQRQERSAEKQAQKQKDFEEDIKNIEYQNTLFQNRGGGNKKYEQNEKVYNYYKDIYNQKRIRDKDLEHKIVDYAQQRQAQKDMMKRQRDMSLREKRSIEIKDTLEKQLQDLHRRKENQNRTNPEQANYSFISNIFREKKPAYDKRQYSMFLDKQSEEQRMNKMSQKYMNEEQYRYNSNQLNKAITGNYTFDRYHDRSMNNIGDRMNVSAAQPLHLEDAELVKNKLEVARSHHKPGRRIDRSASAFGPIV